VAAWQAVAVPSTVVGGLVEAGVYKDPYFGMNLRTIPGTTYPIGERFTLIPTPADSPFKPAWWYRTEFAVPADKAARRLALHFDGINYRANIWLNGRQIAKASDAVGTFRHFEYDVTGVAVPGANALAVEVFGPEPEDLAIMWVDWNPTPADKNMGLWGDVYLTDSGPVTLRHPYVETDLDVPSLKTARVTVSADLANQTDLPVVATVRGEIGSISFSREVRLAARAAETVRFTPAEVPGLTIADPRVWWPYRYGDQPLYSLAMSVEAGGATSDRAGTTFGIQKYTSELTPEGHRLFRINGKPILVRGGGWASDMLLRPASPERLEAEFRYVREMGLNTIRLEGKLETDAFYDLADRMGILLMPGWCCCDHWEQWKKWDAEDHRVGPASLESQLLRMRNHPSVMVWLNGSDFPPPADVERDYLDVARRCRWQKPMVSNATDAPGPVSGPSGMKMRGPYDYVPPSYWLLDKKNGGAFGFATEIGPGAAVPPIESLKRMLPPDHLWPMDEVWRFHAGGDEFKDLSLFTGALEGRYGKATSAEDYARKAQALAYEGQRAMFEAYGRNRYVSTGVIQWMLNNAWPSMIWHLYDWYLRPGGGYFGAKAACEPLHVQFSYDDRAVAVVNDTLQARPGLTVSAKVFDLDLKERFSREAPVDVGAGAVARALTLPAPAADWSTTYFVRLSLRDAGGREVSRNFYWLSTQEDQLDWAKTEWYYTPTAKHANLRALASLPRTTLEVTPAAGASGGQGGTRVAVRNTGAALAFQVRLKAADPSTGEEILPAFWEDNYFALFPGETRELTVSFPGRPSGAPRVTAEAWNADTTR
ncbi:MAG: glycoside hydrolase family 2, sugar binding, partial [Acidobacteria bacterium]|nr:glycoside hydrolase family 2, sugar binding [Acidobacteriota bacterium]